MRKNKQMKVVYGNKLVELAKTNEKIVVMDADLAVANQTHLFADAFPDRFFNAGIAEQNMVSVAAGFAVSGLIPLVHSIAVFATGRCYGQIRQHVAYSNTNVKVVGGYACFTAGLDGASHQSVVDIAIMRALPNMTVVVPADSIEMEKATEAVIDYEGPVYLRIPNGPTPLAYKNDDFDFELGKAVTLKDGNDITIVATGTIVSEAVNAAESLSSEGISARVINIHTIKPIDENALIKAASETKGLVIAEEHSKIGGLSSAITEVLADNSINTKVVRMGISNLFGESGEPDQLKELHKLTANDIVESAKSLI